MTIERLIQLREIANLGESDMEFLLAEQEMYAEAKGKKAARLADQLSKEWLETSPLVNALVEALDDLDRVLDVDSREMILERGY